MNNYLVTIRDKDGDYDFFVIVAEDIDHAWEVAHNLCSRLKKWIFVNVDLIEYIRAQYQAKDKNADINASCHSTNEKIRHIGGSKSNSTEESYLTANP